jgi:hypothetical protein
VAGLGAAVELLIPKPACGFGDTVGCEIGDVIPKEEKEEAVAGFGRVEVG